MIATFLAALQLAATVPAIQIESTTSTEAKGPVPASSSKSVMTVAGANVKMEELERTGPAMPGRTAGSYMLMIGSERKMYSVDPQKKEYFEFDVARMQSQITAMMKSMPGMQMKFSDLEAKVEDLGDGEPLLGHPTRHFRITNALTMNAVVMSDSMSISMETSSDTYFAKDLAMDTAAMMSGDTSMLTQFREFIPGIDANKFREQFSKLPKLVPLKTVTKSSSYFGPMDMTMTITQLVTRVEKKQMPALTFTIPAGYKKVEMPEFTAGARQ